MNQKQLEKMKNGKGFIAALDQSGGSTPKALRLYGVEESAYSNDEEMFTLVHEMRTRIIKSPSFTSDRVLAAILFENTMDRKIDDKFTADYLWDVKGIIPILKVDKGLMDLDGGVQLMKPIPGLDKLLARARDERHIFGTKMRSVIKEAAEEGIKKIVDQQFEIGLQIAAAGLVPILEPEVDIHCPDKAKAEEILKKNIMEHLAKLPEDTKLMFKVTIPTIPDTYAELIADDVQGDHSHDSRYLCGTDRRSAGSPCGSAVRRLYPGRFQQETGRKPRPHRQLLPRVVRRAEREADGCGI